MERTTEEILAAIRKLDTATLQETLAYLLKVYVIDKGSAAGETPAGAIDEQSSANTGSTPGTFAELIAFMKEQYPMAELKRFSIEDGNVFVTIDGRKFRLNEAGKNEPPERPTNQSQSTTPRDVRQKKEGSNMSSRFEKLELD